MDIVNLLKTMEDSDPSVAYGALKELEKLSDTCDALYPHIHDFLAMIKSEKYVMRVRGFRLFCKQARWDRDNIIDGNMGAALTILSDQKPTAVREALAALHDIVRHKPGLKDAIRSKALEIDPFVYKDTMHSLIAKDVDNLLKTMEDS